MFKAMLLYRILDPLHVELLNDWERLGEALADVPAKQPTGSQWGTCGFDLPAPTISDQLVWSGHANSTLFSLYFHERQLPGATIRDHLNERIRKIEEREQRKCYRKEIAQMKDEVIAALLPKAFIKHSAVNMLVRNDLLIVCCSSVKRAEDCLTTLRHAIGSLSVRPLTLTLPGDTWLTDLMHKQNLGDLFALDSAKLVNSTKDVVTFKGVDLSDEEPQSYIHDHSFKVAELAVSLNESLYFRVTDQLIFKAMKFSDIQLDQLTNDAQGDPAALLDGNLTLFLGEVERLVDTLRNVVGEDEAKRVIRQKPTDLIAEAARLFRDSHRASVNLLMRNVICTTEEARRVLVELVADGLLEEGDDGVFRFKSEGYTAPEEAAPDGLADAKPEPTTDEFGDPIKATAEEDDDL